MNKNEALKRLEAIEEETKQLKSIIETPDNETTYGELNAGQYFRFKNHGNGGIKLKLEQAYLILDSARSARSAYSAAYLADSARSARSARSAYLAARSAAFTEPAYSKYLVTIIPTDKIQLTVKEID
jgi:hypothetical protein